MTASGETAGRGFAAGLLPTTVVPGIWDLTSAAAAAAGKATHLFLSGGALSASLGYPDNGLIDISEATETVRRIRGAVSLPLMADIETGYGSLQRLVRLTTDLLAAGLDAVMIEDQEETGQSVSAVPALCSPEIMVERIRRVRSVGGADIKILARSDCIAGMPFAANLERLARYRDAGADWVLPVFATHADLELASREFPTQLWVIAVPSVAPPIYIPTLADAVAFGAVAALVTSQIRNAFRDMMRTFQLSVSGAWDDVRAGMMPAPEFDRYLNRGRLHGAAK